MHFTVYIQRKVKYTQHKTHFHVKATVQVSRYRRLKIWVEPNSTVQNWHVK